MAVSGMHYTNFWVWESVHSVTFSFSPTSAVAQTSLSLVAGGGIVSVGIRHYETRPHPNGPNKDFNFGWNDIGAYPGSIYDPHLTSVTAEMWVGDGDYQGGYATLNVWFLE
jgi:hypothetical protein